MDQLPVEILNSIFELLDSTSDVQATRLTCRYLAASGLQYLTPTVNLVISEASLQRFRHISEHPELRHHIRCVRFRRDMLNKFKSKEKWAKCLTLFRARPFELVPDYENVDVSLYLKTKQTAVTGWNLELLTFLENFSFDLAWNHHQRISTEQWDLLRSHRLAVTLLYCFSQLSRLTDFRLEFDFGHPDYVVSALFESFNGYYIFNSTRNVTTASITSYLMEHILHGIHNAKAQIKGISVTGLYGDHIISFPSWFESFSEPVINLKSIQKISLFTLDGRKSWPFFDRKVKNFGEMKKISETNSGAIVRNFMTALPNLESLTVSIYCASSHWDTKLSGELVGDGIFGGDIHWRHLNSIYIHGLEIEIDKFLSFFVKHSTSIKRLSLANISLEHHSRTWIDVLKSLKQCLSLKDACFARYLHIGTDNGPGWKTISMDDHVFGYSQFCIFEALRFIFCRKPPQNVLEGDLEDLKKITLDDLVKA